MSDASRPIREDERTGVLHPRNLVRYAATFHEPDPSIADVVDTFWTVAWNFAPGERVSQSILADPVVTLSVETGHVPAERIITGVHSRAWTREIEGKGSVFAMRLRPAGLGVLSDLSPAQVANSTVHLTSEVDGRAHGLISLVAAESTVATRIAAATLAIAHLLRERPLTFHQRLANDVVASIRDGRPLQSEVSARTVQRALAGTVGHGPAWVRRWVRLQEVARDLAANGDSGIAEIATRHGYADQPHLVKDFRSAVGLAPGQYVRSLRHND